MSENTQVILIMTDTQRADMLGCYGSDLKTPSLDRLAGQGIRFERAYTCQPVCGPARAAMFTGTFPHSNGGWANSMAIGDNVKTIGQRLTDNGIRSAYIGKWHVDGGDYFGLGRCPAGWDPAYWYDMRLYLEELSPEDRVRSRRAQTMTGDGGISEGFTFGHRVSNRAIDFLEKSGGQDFFLTVSYDEPHGPFLCPEPYASMYEDYEFPKSANIWDDLEGKPEHQRVWAGDRLREDKEALAIKRRWFFGCHTFVDHEIGRVLEAVDRLCPNALLIYTSDHGDMLFSHSLEGKGPVMYEEVVRIPLLVRWAGRAPSGVVCPHPSSHIDLVPTILDVFDLPIPRVLEGRSIRETIVDPASRVNDQIFMEFNRFEIDHDGFGGFQPIRCVFDGRCKLAVNLLSSDELYDLETDPQEMQNLIRSAAHVEIRDSLHDRLLDWMNETRDPLRGYYWERRPWRASARPATWDYTGMTRQRENEEYESRQLDYDTGLPMERATRKKG
jgi:uncharacterized sulfatase